MFNSANYYSETKKKNIINYEYVPIVQILFINIKTNVYELENQSPHLLK